MKQFLLSSTMLILLSGLFSSFNSTSYKAGAFDGYSTSEPSVNGMSIQKIDALAEKTCGGADGEIIIYLIDTQNSSDSYNVTFNREGFMDYEVTGLTQLPLNLGGNYVAGTYQGFTVTRASDGETIVSNKPQKLEGGCGSGPIISDNKGGAEKMTCGLTGTFTYQSCTGPQTIDRANLQASYYTHTSPSYNPGCIAWVNENCEIEADLLVHCGDKSKSSPGAYTLGTLNFERVTGLAGTPFTEVMMERFNWMFDNENDYTQTLQNAIWDLTNPDGSLQDLAQAAVNAVPVAQGGIAERMVTYMPNVTSVQPMIERTSVIVIHNPCGSEQTIDVQIQGMNSGSDCMTIANTTEMTKVTAEAYMESSNFPNTLAITASGGSSGSITYNVPGVVAVQTTGGGIGERLYRATFTGNFTQVCFSGTGSSDVESMALYVERNEENAASSLITIDRELHDDTTPAGQDDCTTIMLYTGEVDTPRDVFIKVPVHEKANDPREVRITANALDDNGSTVVTNSQTFTTQNAGDAAALYEINLVDVPGGVTTVQLEICSPDPNGASVGFGAIVMGSFDCTTPTLQPEDYILSCADDKTVDVYGHGANNCNGNPDTQISIPTPSNVYQTIVEVVYKFENPGNFIVITADGTDYTLAKMLVTGSSPNVYVYSGVLPGNISTISHNDIDEVVVVIMDYNLY